MAWECSLTHPWAQSWVLKPESRAISPAWLTSQIEVMTYGPSGCCKASPGHGCAPCTFPLGSCPVLARRSESHPLTLHSRSWNVLPTGPSGRTEWGPCWPLCVNFGRKCLFLVDKFRKGDCSPRMCNFGAEVTFVQGRVAISREGVFSWPEHRAWSRPSCSAGPCSAVRFSLCFLPFSTSRLAIPLMARVFRQLGSAP